MRNGLRIDPMVQTSREAFPLDSRISVSVVIPCYASSECLIELVERLIRVFEEEIRESFEIVLVDDGSPDPKTWPMIEGLASEHPPVRAFQLSRNFGKPNALVCGYTMARGQWVLAMDDDLQHLPEDIPKLLEERPCGLVMGKFEQRKHVWWQRAASSVKGWLDYQLIGKPKDVYLSPFHLIGRENLDAMLSVRTPNPHIGALMMHVSRDVKVVSVGHQARTIGRSNYTLGRRIRQFSNLLVNNSSLLLRLVATLGLTIASLSFVMGLFLVYRALVIQQIVPGWTSLMVVTLIIGGVIMLSLGVVGEYLLRIINGIENRPAFVVRRSTSSDRLPDE